MDRRTAIDLFAGAGGATQGLKAAGFDVIAAVENDANASSTYRLNHAATVLFEADIRTVDSAVVREKVKLQKGELDLLKACPPCQGFSSLANGAVDEARNDLVLDVARFVRELLPKAILLENVTGLGRDDRLAQLLGELQPLGYAFKQYIIQAADFGIPQRRRRLIVFGIRHVEDAAVQFPHDIHNFFGADVDVSVRTAGQALDLLARNAKPGDPLNKSRTSRPAVAARIAAIPENGTRFDLPVEHQLECHKALAASGKASAAGASYGRVKRASPAPTMTTRCTTPSCGSFIHPSENRGLTLREAATFQTFPYEYQFFGHYDSVERQIGNAVPVRLAELLGLAVLSLLAGQPAVEAAIN